MLEGLDLLDWKRVSHAYGDAADVPAQIRALLSSEKKVRDVAFEALFSNIHHQGTVYSATVWALPFLLDILDADATPDREALIILVASIIAGRGYCEVHYARDLTNPFTGKPMSRPHDLDQRLAEERVIVRQIREIGVRAVPTLLAYLKHDNAGFRHDAALALASYALLAPTIVPALEDAHSTESDEETRNVMASALAALTKDSA